ISAMARDVGAAATSVLCFQCSPYHSNTPLYPVIRQLEQLASIDRREQDENKFAKLENLFKHWDIADGEVPSLLADLCGIELDERFPAFTIGPREKRYRTIEALKAWCRLLVRDRPLLLIFEDLQWIDPTSKMLLNQLVDWAKTA